MIPLSIPNLQAPPPVQTSLVAGTPSETSVSRLPFSAVPATGFSSNVQNNSRGSQQMRMAQAGAQQVASSSVSFSPAMQTSAGGSISFSSTFLAQLFGQSSGQDMQTLQSFLVSEPLQTLDYDTLVAFSQVKYMPSGAALPRPESRQPFMVATREFQAVQQQADYEVQVRTVQLPPTPTPAPANQNMSMVMQAANAVPQPAPAPAPARPRVSAAIVDGESRTTSKPVASTASLIRVPEGVNAYLATTTRNAANLNQPPQDEFKVQMVL